MKTDPPHILCINPWIHDFAAYDFWAKPLGLLTLAAILRDRGIRVSYIDCLDRFHPAETRPPKVLWDGRGPFRKTKMDLNNLSAFLGVRLDELEDTGRTFSRYGIRPEWFEKDLKAVEKPDLIFVTSLMTYWASGVKETIAKIKDIYPDVPVVLGGIYASLCYGHAVAESLADRVVTGPGEPQLKGIIKEFTGFDPDVDLDGSGLSGSLDELPHPALDLQTALPYAPILTSRGCPFACEYCASSFLEPKLRQRDPDAVFQEITHWHREFKVKNFAFYDDALLVNAERHAFPLFEKIIDSGMDLFFHTPNALHIRSITGKAADLMFRAGFKTIRLGLETTNFSKDRTLDVKVAKEEFDAAVENLGAAGFSKDQVGAYLLCGLPGQDLSEAEASVNFVRSAGITPVLAYYTPIPHTPLWEKAVTHSKYDLDRHPLFTNNTLFPCVLSHADLDRISQLKNSLR